ncbi:MAG: hypothetical protein JSS66_17405 [Armatimonadetes bacterium]|nr:hypothetical protein [Armatimonadota bacterium]
MRRVALMTGEKKMNKIKLTALLWLVAACFLFAGCGGGSTQGFWIWVSNPDPVNVVVGDTTAVAIDTGVGGAADVSLVTYVSPDPGLTLSKTATKTLTFAAASTMALGSYQVEVHLNQLPSNTGSTCIKTMTVNVVAAPVPKSFFAENINPIPGGKVRGPRTTVDSVAAEFKSKFGTTGVEDFEAMTVGPVLSPQPITFAGTSVQGQLMNYNGAAPIVHEIADSSTLAGAYPTSGKRFLLMGLDQGVTPLSTDMHVVFQTPVYGFGLYLTEIERTQPEVTIVYAGGGSVTQTIPVTIYSGQSQNGNIAFWGWLDPKPISRVILRKFGLPGFGLSDRVGIDDLIVGVGAPLTPRRNGAKAVP